MVKSKIAGLDLTTRTESTAREAIVLSDLEKYNAYNGQVNHAWNDGEKFPGGYGATQILTDDYWTMRARSEELFKTNLYAAGIIKRLVTNEVHTGLTPEAVPDENVLGVEPDSLNDWSEDVESRYHLYGKNPKTCDFHQRDTLGALQRHARTEALICGDMLIVQKWSQLTQLPTTQLINGNLVQTPPFSNDVKLKKGHTIKHGVELDSKKRIVAHWIKQEDLDYKRIPAYGEKTGRRISWLVYGTQKRFDNVRGLPLLSLVLQSLKEIDRYRDSTQRKALINSIVSMVVTKKDDKIGSLPTQNGAVKRGTVDGTTGSGETRNFNFSKFLPGTVIDELQTGEDVVMKGGDGTDINFGPFEATIMQAVAWANEIPPEILMLAFSNNYSASQAALNEFIIYLSKFWVTWGEDFCTPIYTNFLLAEVAKGKIKAPGLLEAWRDPAQYDIFGAWISVDWYGSVKPTTDAVKQGKAAKQRVDEGWSTNARESRMINGSKFSKNIKRLKSENAMKVEARRPMAEFEKEMQPEPTSAGTASTAAVEALTELNDNVLTLIDSEAG